MIDRINNSNNMIVRINNSNKITSAVYSNDFPSEFPFILSTVDKSGVVTRKLMTTRQQKMIICMIACAKEKGNAEVRIPYEVFKAITGDTKHYTKEQYEKHLFGTMMVFQNGFISDNDEGTYFLPFFVKESGIDKETKEIVFTINEKFTKYFNGLTRGFTVLQLSETAPLDGKYAMVLYRLLIQWDSVGQLNIPMSVISKQMCLPPSYANNTRNLTRMVINPAIEELRKKVIRFSNLSYKYDSKYKPSCIIFCWQTPERASFEDTTRKAKKLERAIKQAIGTKAEDSNSYAEINQQEQESISVDSYIPTEDDVRNYILANDIDLKINIPRFLMYCRKQIQRNKNWNNAGCIHGWIDYFDAYIVDEDKYSTYTQQNTSVPLPEYMSKPLSDSRQPSEELLDKVRKMQNELKN